MLTTNSDVQALFAEAINLIPDVVVDYTDPDPVDVKTQMVKNALVYLKLYSASSNSIPGLRGLGLDEGIALAHQVIALGGKVGNLRGDSKHIAKAFV